MLFAKMNQDLELDDVVCIIEPGFRGGVLDCQLPQHIPHFWNSGYGCSKYEHTVVKWGAQHGGHLSKDGQLLLLYCLEVTEVAQVC